MYTSTAYQHQTRTNATLNQRSMNYLPRKQRTGLELGHGDNRSNNWSQSPGIKVNGKKGSKALALVNKHVQIWAGFFTASLLVFFLLSGRTFSFLMTYGAMARMFGLGILNYKIFTSGRATGISKKTLQLYSLVFAFRLSAIVGRESYLPYDKSGDWFYHLIEFLSLLFTASAMWACASPFKHTYREDLDNFGEAVVPSGYGSLYLVVPVFVIAVFMHPNLEENIFCDISWTFAMYLESVSLVPQLRMFKKQESRVVELLTAHSVAALGFGRLMDLVFWLSTHESLANAAGSMAPGYIALISQMMQLMLMLDFWVHYYRALKSDTPLVLPSSSTLV